MATLRLDYLGDWYCEKLRKAHKPPKVFRPLDTRHHASQQWLAQNGLYLLYHPNQHCRDALRILKTPRAKEFVEAMLVSSAPRSPICREVARFTDKVISLEALELYEEFFWRIDLLTSTELRALLYRRAEIDGGNGDPEIAAQATFIKRASGVDPVRHAAQLPYGAVSALTTQMRMGTMPRNVGLVQLLGMIEQTSALKCFETLHTGYGLDGAIQAKEYMAIVKMAHEVAETLHNPDKKLYDQLNAISLETRDDHQPTLQELSGGEHTTDLGPPTNPMMADGEDEDTEGDLDDPLTEPTA